MDLSIAMLSSRNKTYRNKLSLSGLIPTHRNSKMLIITAIYHAKIISILS